MKKCGDKHKKQPQHLSPALSGFIFSTDQRWLAWQMVKSHLPHWRVPSVVIFPFVLVNYNRNITESLYWTKSKLCQLNSVPLCSSFNLHIFVMNVCTVQWDVSSKCWWCVSAAFGIQMLCDTLQIYEYNNGSLCSKSNIKFPIKRK